MDENMRILDQDPSLDDRLDLISEWCSSEVRYAWKKNKEIWPQFRHEFDKNGFDTEVLALVFETYLHRAKILGINTPAGRQAFGKAAAGLFGILHDMLIMYGLPKPGLSSGEIQEWNNAE